MKWPRHIQLVLDNTQPLEFDRGRRLPLYLWPAMNPGRLDEATAEKLVRHLDKRGIGLVCSWDHRRREQSLDECLPVARAQKRLGLRVNINANACLHSFFNGDSATAHIDEAGQPFWDSSFGKKDMGCPFALNHRRSEIRERIEFFVDAYRKEELPIDFVWADWEVDGPLEWNEAHAAARKCKRCRQHIPDIENFLSYQKALREIRAGLQRQCYTEPILSRFLGALVGNYAVYPHDGYRYWYDYFERYVDGQPALSDQRARYRLWYNEFPLTGYTFAMPVVYTWYPTFGWYDFDNPDYRWFYNMLLVASNAGRHTPQAVPIISFVHWHTTSPPKKPDPDVKQMSEQAYQELLWHMLLRGHDTFFLWCPANESASEVRLLHSVWAAAQKYGEFLDKAMPVSFDVPKQPGPVVSGLRLGEKVLVRRTDFTDRAEPVELKAGGKTLWIKPAPGRCQILKLESVPTRVND